MIRCKHRGVCKHCGDELIAAILELPAELVSLIYYHYVRSSPMPVVCSTADLAVCKTRNVNYTAELNNGYVIKKTNDKFIVTTTSKIRPAVHLNARVVGSNMHVNARLVYKGLSGGSAPVDIHREYPYDITYINHYNLRKTLKRIFEDIYRRPYAEHFAEGRLAEIFGEQRVAKNTSLS